MGEYKNVPQEINDVVSDNIKKLAQLFPSAVKDGQLDIDALKEELGTFEEVGKEKYEFTWSGKQNAKKIAQQDVFGKTLKFCPEKSKNADTTENIYIEGDNLEALKLLRQNYYNSIKMIYIDPPYNTGNDFVYNDDFSMSQEESDIAEGVVDELGERYTKNVSGNRFHANWCNMIYPRLKLAKDLLTDDGVIFISIDDGEVDNLQKICNEIFGEKNFVSDIIWKRKRGRDNSAKWFSKAHEYLLLYSKNKELFNTGYLELDEETKKAYKNPDNDPRGDYRMLGCWARGTQGGVKYDFTTKDGLYFPERLWLFSKENLTKLDKDDKLIIRGDNIYRKMFIYENKGKIPETLWDDVSNAANASDEIKKLFDDIVFDTPKPTPYIKRMIEIVSDKDATILDFFSGSATTANAVMKMNAEDNGNRKFILVQLAEMISENSNAIKAGFDNVCEIGEERIRRAGDKIKAENPDANIDIGFKVFEIADTNIKWNELELKDEQIDFANLSNNPDQVDFKQGTKDIDVVYEIMLRQKNIPLSSKVEVLDEIGSRTYLYADSYLVCLETQVTNDMIDKLASLDPTPFKYIFRDSAFKDDIDLKTNAFRRLKAMVEKHAGATKKAYTVEFI